MDVPPTTANTRGKSSAPKVAAATPSKLGTKPTRRKKPAALGSHASEPADVNQLIATTAYFLAAERNFEPGHELEDWLEAERRVHAAS